MTRAYLTTLLDPPWKEKGGGGRGIDYEHVEVRDMPRVILHDSPFNPTPNAHMYTWVTNTHLPSGLWLLGALGFRYITTITWVKKRIGIGQYFRGRTEHMLFGVRGEGLRLRRSHTERLDLHTLIEDEFNLEPEQRGRPAHSQKPDSQYTLIEAASPGPYLEIFARRTRPGWDAWGNGIVGGFHGGS